MILGARTHGVMEIRLQHGGAYTTAIGKLRDMVRANGTKPTLVPVTITHPRSSDRVDLYINMAFEANSQTPPITASLYTVAVRNANGTWRFDISSVTWGALANAALFPGKPDGSYKSLGYVNALPDISDETLAQAVNNVAHYKGTGPIPSGVRVGITRLIIAVSEAVRFSGVEAGIAAVLGKPKATYTPPTDDIHNWGGHVLGAGKTT